MNKPKAKAKRVFKIIGFLLIMSIIFISGAYNLPDYDSVNTPPPPPPVRPPDEPDPVYTELGAPAVIEYGQPMLLSNNRDPLHTYIRYPQAGNPTDEEIYAWVMDFYNTMAVRYNTGAVLSPADFGEINIQFDSYLVDNRYAGVHEYGVYTYTTTDRPQEILKTFNIDLTQFRVLEPGDILDLENPEGLLSLMSLRLLVEHPKTDGYHVYMDETWLSYLLITNEGIKVFLPQGEFLPDIFESLTVLLPYEDLGSSLLIRQSAPLPTMPTPTPVPTPTPEATPTPEPDDTDDTGEGEDGDGDDNNAITDGENNSGEGEEGEGVDGEDVEDGIDGEDGVDGEDGEAEDNGDDGGPVIPDVPPQSGPINPGKPAIALTFDDGPGIYTEELLDLLESYGVRATFFTVGNLLSLHEDTIKRASDIGCEIAAQSWNHKNLAIMSPNDVRRQLETTNDAIEAITGTSPRVFRPPYGAVSNTMRDVAAELGMSMVKWSVDPFDWENMDSDSIYEMVMNQVYDKAIIISHEIYPSTIEAYKRIIPELLAEGYQILTASEMIAIVNWRLEPGYLYYNGEKFEEFEHEYTE